MRVPKGVLHQVLLSWAELFVFVVVIARNVHGNLFEISILSGGDLELFREQDGVSARSSFIEINDTTTNMGGEYFVYTDEMKEGFCHDLLYLIVEKQTDERRKAKGQNRRSRLAKALGLESDPFLHGVPGTFASFNSSLSHVSNAMRLLPNLFDERSPVFAGILPFEATMNEKTEQQAGNSEHHQPEHDVHQTEENRENQPEEMSLIELNAEVTRSSESQVEDQSSANSIENTMGIDTESHGTEAVTKTDLIHHKAVTNTSVEYHTLEDFSRWFYEAHPGEGSSPWDSLDTTHSLMEQRLSKDFRPFSLMEETDMNVIANRTFVNLVAVVKAFLSADVGKLEGKYREMCPNQHKDENAFLCHCNVRNKNPSSEATSFLELYSESDSTIDDTLEEKVADDKADTQADESSLSEKRIFDRGLETYKRFSGNYGVYEGDDEVNESRDHIGVNESSNVPPPLPLSSTSEDCITHFHPLPLSSSSLSSSSSPPSRLTLKQSYVERMATWRVGKFFDDVLYLYRGMKLSKKHIPTRFLVDHYCGSAASQFLQSDLKKIKKDLSINPYEINPSRKESEDGRSYIAAKSENSTASKIENSTPSKIENSTASKIENSTASKIENSTPSKNEKQTYILQDHFNEGDNGVKNKSTSMVLSLPDHFKHVFISGAFLPNHLKTTLQSLIVFGNMIQQGNNSSVASDVAGYHQPDGYRQPDDYYQPDRRDNSSESVLKGVSNLESTKTNGGTDSGITETKMDLDTGTMVSWNAPIKHQAKSASWDPGLSGCNAEYWVGRPFLLDSFRDNDRCSAESQMKCYRGSRPRKSQTFTLDSTRRLISGAGQECHGSERISVKCNKGRGEGDIRIHCSSNTQKWHTIMAGNSGTYRCADEKHRIICNRPSTLTWEEFQLRPAAFISPPFEAEHKKLIDTNKARADDAWNKANNVKNTVDGSKANWDKTKDIVLKGYHGYGHRYQGWDAAFGWAKSWHHTRIHGKTPQTAITEAWDKANKGKQAYDEVFKGKFGLSRAYEAWDKGYEWGKWAYDALQLNQNSRTRVQKIDDAWTDARDALVKANDWNDKRAGIQRDIDKLDSKIISHDTSIAAINKDLNVGNVSSKFGKIKRDLENKDVQLNDKITNDVNAAKTTLEEKIKVVKTDASAGRAAIIRTIENEVGTEGKIPKRLTTAETNIVANRNAAAKNAGDIELLRNGSDGKIEELRTRVKQNFAIHQGQIDLNKKKTEDNASNLATTEGILHTLQRTVHANTQKAATDLHDKSVELTKRLAAAEAAAAKANTANSKAHTSLEGKIAAAKTELDTRMDNKNAEIVERQKKINEETLHKQSQLSDEAVALGTRITRETSKLQTDLTKDMKARDAAVTTSLAGKISSHDTKFTNKITELMDKVNSVNAALMAKDASLVAADQAAEQKFTKDFETLSHDLNKRHTELKASINAKDTSLGDRITSLGNRLDTKDTEQDTKHNKLAKEHRDLKAEIQRVDLDLTKHKSDTDDEDARLNARITQDVSNLDKHYDAEVRALKEVDKQHETALKAEKQRQNTAHTALETQIAALDSRIIDKSNKLHADITHTVSQLTNKVTALTSSTEADKAELEASIKAGDENLTQGESNLVARVAEDEARNSKEFQALRKTATNNVETLRRRIESKDTTLSNSIAITGSNLRKTDKKLTKDVDDLAVKTHTQITDLTKTVMDSDANVSADVSKLSQTVHKNHLEQDEKLRKAKQELINADHSVTSGYQSADNLLSDKVIKFKRDVLAEDERTRNKIADENHARQTAITDVKARMKSADDQQAHNLKVLKEEVQSNNDKIQKTVTALDKKQGKTNVRLSEERLNGDKMLKGSVDSLSTHLLTHETDTKTAIRNAETDILRITNALRDTMTQKNTALETALLNAKEDSSKADEKLKEKISTERRLTEQGEIRLKDKMKEADDQIGVTIAKLDTKTVKSMQDLSHNIAQVSSDSKKGDQELGSKVAKHKEEIDATIKKFEDVVRDYNATILETVDKHHKEHKAKTTALDLSIKNLENKTTSKLGTLKTEMTTYNTRLAEKLDTLDKKVVSHVKVLNNTLAQTEEKLTNVIASAEEDSQKADQILNKKVNHLVRKEESDKKFLKAGISSSKASILHKMAHEKEENNKAEASALEGELEELGDELLSAQAIMGSGHGGNSILETEAKTDATDSLVKAEGTANSLAEKTDSKRIFESQSSTTTAQESSEQNDEEKTSSDKRDSSEEDSTSIAESSLISKDGSEASKDDEISKEDEAWFNNRVSNVHGKTLPKSEEAKEDSSSENEQLSEQSGTQIDDGKSGLMRREKSKK